jgi:hypothetical protein
MGVVCQLPEPEDAVFGRMCTMKYMEHANVTEEGIHINPEALKEFELRPYQQVVAEIGKKLYPLNLYGG